MDFGCEFFSFFFAQAGQKKEKCSSTGLPSTHTPRAALQIPARKEEGFQAQAATATATATNDDSDDDGCSDGGCGTTGS
jgi:hypothetical protein